MKKAVLAILTASFVVASAAASDRMLINSEGLIVFFDQRSAQPKLFWAGSGAFFLNDDGLITTMDPEVRGLVIRDETIQEARLSKECRPTSEDVEGNWGKVLDGLQMSIRFETNSFASSQPIRATVILRNVTNDMRYYTLVIPGDALLHLHAVDQDGNPVRRKRDLGVPHNSFRVFVRPGTQRKEIVVLGDSLDLKEGEYAAWVVRYIPDEKAESEIATGRTRLLAPDPDRKSTNDIISGRARFTIKRRNGVSSRSVLRIDNEGKP